MANPLNLNNKRSDAGGYAKINCIATATAARSGSSVTITVTVKVYDSQGHYFNVTLNGDYVIEQQNTTVTKTFTYDDATAKTCSFPMVAYIQTAAGYTGESTTGTLTIDVPAAGAQGYINIGGAKKKVIKTLVNVGGVGKEANAKVNA